MIRLSDDLDDDLPPEDFKNEGAYTSTQYDLENLFKSSEYNDDTEEYVPEISEEDSTLYENLCDCKRFFESKGGKLFLARLQAEKMSKVEKFSNAKPEELLKVQAEFNAWDSVLQVVVNIYQEKNQLDDLE